MKAEHKSALELVRELHAMGATSVYVGDVRAEFPVPVQPLNPASDAEFLDMKNELEALRVMRDALRESGEI